MREMRIWRADCEQSVQIVRTVIASEELLEALVSSDPSILGRPLIIVGRQVWTGCGKEAVDLLAIDSRGVLWIIELKKGPASRGVVSQLFGYGNWASKLSWTEIASIYAHYTGGSCLEDEFCRLSASSLPTDRPISQRFVLLSASTSRPARNELDYLAGSGHPAFELHYAYLTDGATTRAVKVWSAGKPAHEVAWGSSSEPETIDISVPVTPLIGRHCFPILRCHYDDVLRPAHRQVTECWTEYRESFKWDFLPRDFLYALYEQWLERAHPHLAPLMKDEFHRHLRIVATASGDWKFRQASAPYLMTATEPLMRLVPYWSKPTDRAGSRGYRRVHVR